MAEPGTAEMATEIDLKDSIHRLLVSLRQSGIKSIPVVKKGESQNASLNTLPGTLEVPANAALRIPTKFHGTVNESTTGYHQNRAIEQNEMNAKKANSTDNAGRLAIIEKEVSKCTKCAHLVETRTQTVFGTGNPNPQLCFVGEAPGADEDKQGAPFVGRAGQLLDKILEACGLDRKSVYILNTIKCRPPSNRNPNEDEVANCWGYALRQLEILKPEFICCLGGVAAQTVLQTKTPIGKLRGEFHDFNDIRVMVTYHPAYLLRNPNAKKLVWDDMKRLMEEMGSPVD